MALEPRISDDVAEDLRARGVRGRVGVSGRLMLAVRVRGSGGAPRLAVAPASTHSGKARRPAACTRGHGYAV